MTTRLGRVVAANRTPCICARRTVIVTVARNTLRFGVCIIAESRRTGAIFAWKMALRYFQPRRSPAADDESRLGLGTTRSSTTLDPLSFSFLFLFSFLPFLPFFFSSARDREREGERERERERERRRRKPRRRHARELRFPVD